MTKRLVSRTEATRGGDELELATDRDLSTMSQVVGLAEPGPEYVLGNSLLDSPVRGSTDLAVQRPGPPWAKRELLKVRHVLLALHVRRREAT